MLLHTTNCPSQKLESWRSHSCATVARSWNVPKAPTRRRSPPKPPNLKRSTNQTLRLSMLEDYLMQGMGQSLERAFVAGAYPDELLAAVAVVYRRMLRLYSARGDAAGPVLVGDQFHRTMYVNPEVV